MAGSRRSWCGRERKATRRLCYGAHEKEASDALRRLLERRERREYVEPDRVTLGWWLDIWLSTIIEPTRRMRTAETYRNVIVQHLRPGLGAVPLQKLEPEHIEKYFSHLRGTLAPGTLALHSAVLHGALKSAVKKKKIVTNPAELVEKRPRRAASESDEARQHCREQAEARAFLAAARKAGPQPAAFYSVALELGLRKGELCGLQWRDVDLEKTRVTVSRQLVRPRWFGCGRPGASVRPPEAR